LIILFYPGRHEYTTVEKIGTYFVIYQYSSSFPATSYPSES